MSITMPSPKIRKPPTEDNDGFIIFVVVFSTILLAMLLTIGIFAVRSGDDLKDPELRIDSVAVSPPLDATVDHRKKSDLNWNITLSVKNPKEGTGIFYDMVRASLFCEDKFLSATDIEDFYQEADEQTSVRAMFAAAAAASPTHVLRWMSTAMDAFRTTGRAVVFNVKVHARVMLDHGQPLWMRASCNVPISSSTVAGTMPPTAPADMCKVRLDEQF